MSRVYLNQPGEWPVLESRWQDKGGDLSEEHHPIRIPNRDAVGADVQSEPRLAVLTL